MAEKTFSAAVEQLDEAMAFVEGELEKLGCPMKTVMQISVCVEEIFVNVAHYAYGEETGCVTVTVDGGEGAVSITFTDEGIPFDPLAQKEPDITLSAEERDVGGLGILMVKRYMDALIYNRYENRNIFTIKKEF